MIIPILWSLSSTVVSVESFVFDMDGLIKLIGSDIEFPFGGSFRTLENPIGAVSTWPSSTSWIDRKIIKVQCIYSVQRNRFVNANVIHTLLTELSPADWTFVPITSKFGLAYTLYNPIIKVYHSITLSFSILLNLVCAIDQ